MSDTHLLTTPTGGPTNLSSFSTTTAIVVQRFLPQFGGYYADFLITRVVMSSYTEKCISDAILAISEGKIIRQAVSLEQRFRNVFKAPSRE